MDFKKHCKKIYKLFFNYKKKILSTILILFIIINNSLLPISHIAFSNSSVTPIVQFVEFKYQTKDNKTPNKSEYKDVIISATNNFTNPAPDSESNAGSNTGSSFIGPHEAGNSPSIEGIIDGLPMVIILRAGEVTDGNLARTWTETKDKYQNANPLIVRIGEVTFNTTIRQAEQTANAIVQMGFPEGTIVVYGNELNNLYKEWGSRSSPPEAPATSSELIKAAEEYAGLFKAFADITQPSGLKAAVAPVDLYNYYFPPDKWMQTVGDMGSYDLALATVANAYDTYRVTSGGTDGPGIDTVLDAIKNIEEKTGKPVDFLTEIGPHPDESIQAHIDYLNTVAQPTNSAGFPLKASTLIENKCNNSTTDDSSNSWLFYVKGKVFDKAGREVDATSCVTSLSTEYDAVTLSGMVVSGKSLPVRNGIVDPNSILQVMEIEKNPSLLRSFISYIKMNFKKIWLLTGSAQGSMGREDVSDILQENDYFKTTPGLEGFVVVAYENIDFASTSYHVWTHATTTNKNGKFAIPIDKSMYGAFLVVLRPEANGRFKFVASYEVSNLLPEHDSRRPENSLIITVNEEPIKNPQLISYHKDFIPEFVNLYSLDKDNKENNYYACGAESNNKWADFNREADINLKFEDKLPFHKKINENTLEKNTFDLLGDTRSLECIKNNPIRGKFGTTTYIKNYEEYDCWKKGENTEPFIYLNQQELYTKETIKEGLQNFFYLKSTSNSSNFYNGPLNLKLPIQSNKDLLIPDCKEFKSSYMLSTDDPNKNMYTYAGYSALEIPQITNAKISSGQIDPNVLNTTACKENGINVSFKELIDKGFEFPSLFFNTDYLGPGGAVHYTDISNKVSNDSTFNYDGNYTHGSNPDDDSNFIPLEDEAEPGRDTSFSFNNAEDENFGKKMAAIRTQIHDAHIENYTIYGDYAQNSSGSNKTGSYNTFLYPFANRKEENIYIYEIGPQRSLCEKPVGSESNSFGIIENDRVLLQPINPLSITPFFENNNNDLGWVDAGWKIDNSVSICKDKSKLGIDGGDECEKTINDKEMTFLDKKVTDTFFNKIKNAFRFEGFKDIFVIDGSKTNVREYFSDECIKGDEVCAESIADYNDALCNSRYDYCGGYLFNETGPNQCLIKDEMGQTIGKYEYFYKKNLYYDCTKESNEKLNIKVIEADSTQALSNQEERTLNDNALMIVDSFKLPNLQSYQRPLIVGKKRVDLYGFLNRPVPAEEKRNSLTSIFESIRFAISRGNNDQNSADDEDTVFTQVVLSKDGDNNTSIEPASANISWLRHSVGLPDGFFNQNITSYNPAVYRYIKNKNEIVGDVYIRAGSDIVIRDGDEDGEDSFPGGCPVTCDPKVNCWAYDSSGGSCRHGSASYWSTRDVCSWPIPAYNFPNTKSIFHPSCIGENIEPRSKYGWALDVQGSTCNLVTAPQIKNIRDWRVASVKKDGNDSYVMITGNGTGGTYYMNLHHLRSETIRSNIKVGETLTPGAIIAEYYGHVHIEMAVNGSYIKPEDHLWGCYLGEGRVAVAEVGDSTYLK